MTLGQSNVARQHPANGLRRLRCTRPEAGELRLGSWLDQSGIEIKPSYGIATTGVPISTRR